MKSYLLSFLLLGGLPLNAEPVTLTVSAAMSLKAPLETLKPEFEKAHPGVEVVFNFGSSGALQQQIVNGAPVDVYISAANRQMDELEKAGVIVPSSRSVLLGNSIVLIAPAASTSPKGFEDLPATDIKKIAVGEPKSVPVGMYATEVFSHFGLTEAIQDKLVFGKDVRQVLVYVETGNVDAGIVYGSDAASSKAVRLVAAAPAGSHKTVEYPAAVIKASAHATEAGKFLDFLRQPDASALFKSAGFVIYPAP